MLLEKEILELEDKGFIELKDYLTEECINTMNKWFEMMKNSTDLPEHVAYPSYNSDNRESNAYMVSTGTSFLPNKSLSLFDFDYIPDLIEDFQMLVAQTSGGVFEDVCDTRCLINSQTYKGKSSSVPKHFDGEYLVSGKEYTDKIEVVEALVPQYVAIYILDNGGDTKSGTNLHEGDKIIRLPSNPKSMFIFNNTRFLHSVDELDNKRSMFGLRNFDYNPWHYSQKGEELDKYTNACFSGYRRKISKLYSRELIENFLCRKDKTIF